MELATPRPPVLDLLRRERLVAVLRGADADALTAATAVLAANGVRLIELTLSSDAGLTALRRVAADRTLPPDTVLGAGTVLTRDQARAAIDAGARYLVTPGVTEEVLAEGVDQGVPVLCGALTPSEAMAAVRLGATAVKLFPAYAVGGARYLRDLRAPLPDVPFIAIGGIALDDIADYFAAGAVAVGVGSPLLREAGTDSSPAALAALAERAQAYVAATSAER